MTTQLERSFAGRWIGAVVSNLRKIAILCFIVAVMASAYALTRKQLWSAYAVASVPGGQQSPGLGGLGGIASDLLGDNLSGITGMMGIGGSQVLDMNLVFQVLTSRSVFERVIFKYDMLAELKVPSMDKALDKFSEYANVTLTEDGFFVISMQADSREKAAAIVNDIIDFANQELSTIITSRARRSRIAAETQLKAAQDSLDVAQGRMEQFREESGLLFPEEQGISSVQLLASMETDLIKAESQLAGISGTMSSTSPAYIEIARQVEYLRNSLGERATQGDTLSYLPGMDSMPSMLRDYENLTIDLETRRAIYLMLRQELESLKLEEAKESPTIEVLVPPVPSALRAYPKRGKIVIKYTFLAFFLSLLWLAAFTYGKQLLEDEETGPFWRSVLSTAGKQLFILRKRKPEDPGRS